MIHFLKVSLVAIGVVTVGLLCFGAFGDDVRKPFSAAAESRGPASSGRAASYHPSDEAIDVYQIANNPFVLKGHSGILDPTELSVFSSVGKRYRLGHYASSLRFEKMLDENTAAFEVLSGEDRYGEVAVAVANSQPPDTSRQWRVFVDSPTEGVNALGTALTVTKLVFEGYYEPSEKESLKPSIPEPTAQQERLPSTDGELPDVSASRPAGKEMTTEIDSRN